MYVWDVSQSWLFVVFLIGACSVSTDVLSKLKADDIGVMSLLDCVFVKTDIGAVVTQGR